jgi:hypothetical protein
MLDKDSIEAARLSVKNLNDNRFQHFYDQDQIAGKEIAMSVGWHGHVAWDIYLFYAPRDGWNNSPPAPKNWVHQLRDRWADKAHFRRGDDLDKALSDAMRTLSGQI